MKMIMSTLLTALVVLVTLSFAQDRAEETYGGYVDIGPHSTTDLSLLDAQLTKQLGLEVPPPSGVRTLRPFMCPCRCMPAWRARKQCSKLGAFCALSGCRRTDGQSGQRCCRRSVAGSGRCECLGNRVTLGISYHSQLAARNAAASHCAEKRVCPPNCDCSACPVANVFCLQYKAVWTCRADCGPQNTSCRRTVG